MVQRKGLIDHLKCRTAPPEVKKKVMKKSASIKPFEADSARSTRRVKEKPPGEPPPMSSIAKTPNYMKSTSSSDARKEQSRVSFKSPSSDCLNSLRKGSKKGFNAGNLALSSSLKTMRTLKKNPSFKLVRASAKKCSKVVLCENLDLQKATCSSILKDCKFPAYLRLNHGGTESEGTSAVKVCPYTYCSLNGHHHAPLPPLKSFLSARRRSATAQRRGKCVGNGSKLDEMVVAEDDAKSPRVGSSCEEEQRDFFVEIFCIDGSDKTAADNGEEGVMEMHLDEETEVVDADPECSTEAAVEIDLDCEHGFFDESMEDEASQMSWDDDICAFSGSDDGECNGLCDCQQSLDTVQTAADVEFPAVAEAEPEPACEDKGSTSLRCDQTSEICVEGVTEEETLFGDLKSLQDKDVITTTGDLIPNEDVTGLAAGEGTCHDKTENMISDESSIEECCQVQIELLDDHQISNTEIEDDSSEPEGSTETSAVDLAIESKMEVAARSPTGAERITVDKVTDVTKPEGEDNALARIVAKSRSPVEESDELGPFNPRPPNFLPLEPDPDAEKVDLKHQELDERKNTEEWMVDYALRQVVAKLGPARKRKVALLVEAFERVSPITKCELHMSHNPAFGLPSPIQACR